MNNVGAKDVDAVRIPLAEGAFREVKRHWIKKWKITEFEVTDPILKDFHEHVLLSGRYLSYIEEDRDFGIFNGGTVNYALVYTRS